MGLDWCLKSTVEGKSPLDFIEAERFDPENPRLVEVARTIVASHQEAAKKTSNDQYRRYWLRSEEDIFNDMKGSILVESIPEKYRQYLPAIDSPFGVLSGVEAFRGKRVQYCTLLSQELQDRAFDEMSAEEMGSYADELEVYIPPEVEWGFDFAEMEKKADALDLFAARDVSIPDLFWDVAALKDAVTWLRFWSQHPVRLVPWY